MIFSLFLKTLFLFLNIKKLKNYIFPGFCLVQNTCKSVFDPSFYHKFEVNSQWLMQGVLYLQIKYIVYVKNKVLDTYVKGIGYRIKQNSLSGYGMNQYSVSKLFSK